MPVFFKDIENQMSRLPRSFIKYVKGLRVLNLEAKSAVGIKTVTYNARVQGEKKSDGKRDGPYLTSIKFFDVSEFSDEIKSPKNYVKTSVGSETVYALKPDLNKNKCQIKCSCDDFRFVWEYPLSKKKGLIGTFRRYVRKTPPPPAQGAYPFRNPADHLGYCKHVSNLMRALKKRKLIK